MTQYTYNLTTIQRQDLFNEFLKHSLKIKQISSFENYMKTTYNAIYHKNTLTFQNDKDMNWFILTKL